MGNTVFNHLYLLLAGQPIWENPVPTGLGETRIRKLHYVGGWTHWEKPCSTDVSFFGRADPLEEAVFKHTYDVLGGLAHWGKPLSNNDTFMMVEPIGRNHFQKCKRQTSLASKLIWDKHGRSTTRLFLMGEPVGRNHPKTMRRVVRRTYWAKPFSNKYMCVGRRTNWDKPCLKA